MSERGEQRAAFTGPESARAGMGMGMGGRGQGRILPAAAKPQDAGVTLRRLWGYLGRQRIGMAVVFALTALGTGSGLVGPYLIGKSIDDYIIPGDAGGLFRICLVLLCAYVLSSLLAWVQAYVMVGVSQRTVWHLRRDLFGKLQRLPLRFFDSRTHGELMSRTTNDIENVSNTLNQSLTQLLSSFLTIVGSLSFMFALDWRLSLVSLTTIPLVVLTTRIIARRTRAFFSENQRNLGELNGFIEETVSGQKVVKAFRGEQKAVDRFQAINERLRDVGVRAQIFSGVIFPVMNVFNNLGFALVAAIGGWMALAGHTSIGVVVSFLGYSKQFSRPINDLANQFNMIQSAVAGAERVFEIMDMKAEDEEDAGLGKAAEKVRGEVEFKRVSFYYKENEPVLNDISLIARPGDTIALVGPTGSGKTTVVNLLSRFYDFQEGSISIDGVDIREMDRDGLRRQLGIVLQDAYLFSDTIRENIRYGRPDAADEEVEAAARLANADGFIRRLPDGYGTVLSAEGGNLSQGQRQLITIARAVLADPAILILDEATSSVDTRTEMHIQEAMRVLMKDRTSFVIAHRLGTIREADMILVIHGGRIIERGTHEQLMERKGFYCELYTSQFSKVTA